MRGIFGQFNEKRRNASHDIMAAFAGIRPLRRSDRRTHGPAAAGGGRDRRRGAAPCAAPPDHGAAAAAAAVPPASAADGALL